MKQATFFTIFLLLLPAFAVSNYSHAETRYVSDVMYVPMRSGAGNEYRIIHSRIKSGTKMTVLDSPQNSDWAQIKTAGGLEGWIRKQYLISAPTAKLQLQAAINESNAAKAKAVNLEQQLSDLQKVHTTLKLQASNTTSEHKSISEELKNLKALSADTINLSHRYKDLLAKHDLIQTEFDAVRAENDRLNADRTVNQWLFGAGLIILGMFLMLILPALKSTKRNNEWRD